MRSPHLKKLIFAGVAVIVVIAGLLVAPSFIDWAEYRVVFAQRLSAALGRDVSIDGGVDFVLLPRPAFNADEVRIGGAVADDFVGVERVSARLAFLPLLQGRMQFRELVLHQPEARLTRTAEGSIDFLNRPFVQPSGAANAGPAAATTFDLDVDRVRIINGTVAFQDIANGTSTELRGIDAVITVPPGASVALAGTMTAGSAHLALDASLGRAAGGTQIIAVTLKLPDADATAKFTGTLSAAADAAPGWEVHGDFDVNGVSSLTLMAALGGIAPDTVVPAALRKPFSLKTKIHGNGETITADINVLDLGGTPAKGTVVWKAASPPVLDVKIEVGAVDVEAWRFAALETSFPFALIKTAHAQDSAKSMAAANALFAPFKNAAATFDVRLPALSYRGQALRDGIVRASLAGGELTVSDASIEMPAATRVKAFGFVRLDAESVFEGALEMQTGDVRALMAWLNVDAGAARVPAGQLSNASMRAALQGTPSRFTLNDITATLDTSIITGRISWARGPRPTVNLDLTMNALNIDAYLPAQKTAGDTPVAQSKAAKDNKPAAYGVTPKFTGIGSFADVDANVRLQIDAVTAGGVSNGKVGIDVGLKDAVLKVRTASFENVAGATAWFSGSVSGFGVTPRFDDVQFDLSAGDITRLSRLLGWEPPMALRTLTPVSLTGVLSGTLAQADMAATLKVAGLTVHADGKALTLDQQPHLSVNIEAAQASYAALIKAAGRSWPLNMPDPGAVKVSAHLTQETTQDKSTLKVEDIAFRVGGNVFTGNLNINRKKGAVDVTGALSDVALSLDKLWPKEPATITATHTAGRPVALVPSSGVWSEELLDWNFLEGWRGNFQVSGPSLVVRGIETEGFKFRLGVGEGAVELTEWSGKVFDAPGQIYLRVAAMPVPMVQGEIAFIGGDLAAVAGAVNGGTGGLKSGGKIDFAGSFRMQGNSPAALIGDMAGSGSVKIAATEAGSGPISALLGAVAAANQLEGLSGGGQKGVVTLESRFSAADGRIKIEDATVASKSYGGAFTGIIDLPRWQVDLTGKLRLEARPSADTAARPQSVPIAVKGALDLPNITLLPAS